MAAAVYVLCAATSCACAWLLARGYLATRSRLLLWSALCFGLLTLNNVLLVADRVVWTGTDLALARGISGLAGLMLLAAGLISESR